MSHERESAKEDVTEWETEVHPGYSGKKRSGLIAAWNKEFGEGNWRLAWELKNGKILSYEDIFWEVYVPGYVAYFEEHQDDAKFLTNFSFTYDKDMINREQAFDPYALYNKGDRPNQFHNVALNIALEWNLGMPFKGDRPIQVREGKPGTPIEDQPEGYRWSPGRIPTLIPDLIPNVHLENQWWKDGAIEDLYQKSKVLQIRRGLRK